MTVLNGEIPVPTALRHQKSPGRLTLRAGNCSPLPARSVSLPGECHQPVNIARCAEVLGFQQILPPYRQCAQALAGGGEYRIADRRSHQCHGGFADAAGRFVAIKQVHIEFG
jgi:hypothetical protein